jgi:hypothetical protein
MKPPVTIPVVLLAVLLCLGFASCGGTSKRAQTASSRSSTTGGEVPVRSAPPPPRGQRFLNDGDAEKTSDEDADNRIANHDDSDGDSSEEYEDRFDNGRYHDGDDRGMLVQGHAVSSAQARMITDAVKRYYAAASSGDGAAACSMMAPGLASAIAEDYGYGSAGPRYLRSGRSCQAVMSLLFKHFRHRLAAPVTVTGVRTSGQQTYALLGSPTAPPAT